MQDNYFTPDEWETVKMVLMVLAILPGIFLLRMLLFLILPKSLIKYFFLHGKEKPPELHKHKIPKRRI